MSQLHNLDVICFQSNPQLSSNLLILLFIYSIYTTKLLLILQYNDVWDSLQINP